MLRQISLTVLFIFFVLISVAQGVYNFTINTTQSRKPISPYIYGTNDLYPHAGSKRLGGNRLTGYNWENNASHSGEDLQPAQNDDYVPWQQQVPAAEYNNPASAITYFHNRSLSQGAYSLVTLPMAGYVAADKTGLPVLNSQSANTANWRSRWRRVIARKPTPLSLTPDLSDDNIYVDEEVNFLINRFGRSNTPTGIKGYSLDNEPALWPYTHTRLFGQTPLTVNYLMQRSIELARRIKELDPTAEVFGPASYGFYEYLSLQGAADWNTVNAGRYSLFIEYYLAEMQRQSNLVGHRLLDVLDLHWYPETNFTSGTSPFDDALDPATNKARMDMPRSLWDPAYVENTWIGNNYQNEILPLLPKLKEYVNMHFPGTKLSLSEYSFMGGSHASGGIAQADMLGIFGQQELYFATYWGAVTDYIKAGFDIYRNYDGNGGQFGNTAVAAVTDNQEYSSVYAAVDNLDDSKLHIIAMNKDQESARVANIVVNSPINFRSARVWMFDGTGAVIRQLDNIRVINGNTFQVTLPPLSVYHIVLTTEDLSLHPFIEQVAITPAVGYSDGTSSFTITADITDGDDNISNVTVDLSSVGGSAAQALTRSGNTYTCTYTVQAGTPSGMKSFLLRAEDADGHVGEKTLPFRVIRRLAPDKIWDGDLLEAGEPILQYDPGDSRQGLLRMERRTTGGNEEPGSLFMHMEHDENRWNIFCFRFQPDDNASTEFRDASDYGYLEFYIKSNAPANAEINFSMRDYALEDSHTIPLKRRGYISSFNPNTYTRVRIPLEVLTQGTAFNLAQLWQLNFGTETADRGFDVWIDDIRVIPFSHPSHQPRINNSVVTPAANFADGFTSVTITADVTDPDNDLQTVTVDLSPVNGPNNAAMSLVNGRYTITHFLPASIVKGNKTLTITATDAASNSTQASLPFLVYQKATSDTVWNGDSKVKGSVAFISNDATYGAVEANGGNYRPGVLHMHLEGENGNPWSSVMWDWNDGTDNTNIQDATHKRYLQFYVRVTGNATQPDFDFQVFLSDPFAEFSKSVYLRGGQYLSSFTGSYQLVRIPLSDLLDGTRVDRSQLIRIGINADEVFPANGIDVYFDDITITGSIAADVQMSAQDANCGSNGRITVNNIAGGQGNYTYSINGFSNPDGAVNPQFQGLAPGVYDIKVTGNNDFVYIGAMDVRGDAGINAAATVSGRNVTTSIGSGSGNYSYVWSNGATTGSLTNVPDGVYTVTITDQASGCTTTAQAVVGSPLTTEQLQFSVVKAQNGVMVNWKGVNQSMLKGYEILHSVDGRNFRLIGEKLVDPGKELSGSPYSFLHISPVKGGNYYQVKVIFENGQTTNSTIKAVFINDETKNVVAFPNPAINSVHLKAGQKITGLKVADIKGRSVRNYSYIRNNDGVIIDLKEMVAGMYFITVMYNNGVEVIKLFKQ